MSCQAALSDTRGLDHHHCHWHTLPSEEVIKSITGLLVVQTSAFTVHTELRDERKERLPSVSFTCKVEFS